jgi:hypothetical protein
VERAGDYWNKLYSFLIAHQCGMTHEEIAWNFDMPRFNSFISMIGELPPPAIMLGKLAHYKIQEPKKAMPQNLSQKDHAARLLSELSCIG